VTSRLRENFAVMRSIADGGAEIGLERRSRCRWDAAYAARTATACVDRIFEAAGGRAIFLSNPLQRAFRDAHAMRAHAFNNADNAAQIMARAELGFPNREMLI
jgi:3-hydroxy-9,10-secoandrosta-1,3,5(10)-triene-9,17-dione monooxygenase